MSRLPFDDEPDAPGAPIPLGEQRALVALSQVPGVGPARLRALLAGFGSAEAVMNASTGALSQVPDVGSKTARAIRAFDDFDAVDAQLDRAERVGAYLLPTWDAHYPDLLRHIYDPPPFLWVRGRVLPQDDRALAIVGTRRASEYGRRLAEEFAYELGQRGFTIVSGLAYGIDAAAHRGALRAGARTLAILGSGVDRIYPSRHAQLARGIVEGDQGALVSEFPLGAEPDAANFPRRNRIISGMAHGTLVAEAYETGGALITARLAVEQNREVFALPSPVHSASGEGTNRLIQRGHAKLVLTVEDILDELGPMASPEPDDAGSSEEPPPRLNGVEQTLYDALGPEPTQIEVICDQTGLDASTALVYLLSLEFKGLVRQMAGKQFYRVGRTA
ncbi:MAG: DNA-protecting protein DprA [Bacteroidetes bacterium]|jgi:DNA processing protein|nr:DNA-protecting protein DprA [Bacteroidota bacterium]